MKILSHDKLGITFQEQLALLGVRAALAAGALIHCRDPNRVVENEHLFNMACSGASRGCGSVGCIGGNMALMMGKGMFNYVHDDRSAALYPLFFPRPVDPLLWRTISVKRALRAINLFLAGAGEKCWAKPKRAVKKPVKKPAKKRRAR